jgi:hypothetical protein
MFELHRFIWSVGDGRTDREIRSFHRAMSWPEKPSYLIRELTKAGKIERRGDHRVALCAPWAKPPPKTEPALGPGRAGGEGWVGAAPEDDGRVPCYGQGGEIIDWARPEEIEAAARAAEEELQADRYPMSRADVSAFYERLNRMEQKLDKLARLVEYLVRRENEQR